MAGIMDTESGEQQKRAADIELPGTRAKRVIPRKRDIQKRIDIPEKVEEDHIQNRQTAHLIQEEIAG